MPRITRNPNDPDGRVPAPPSLDRPNLKNEVAAAVREMIFSGLLRPGRRIDQDELAARMQVSKLPVREALIALESEGLVEIVPRRGAYVATLSRLDIADHYNIFGMLSGVAAERAATKLTGAQLDELEDLVNRMEGKPPAEQSELNFRFHRLINRAGGSRRLLSVLALLSNSIPPHFFEFTPGWPESADEAHRLILAALRDRDPQRAREEMERHLRASAEHSVHVLEELGFWREAADAEGDRP
jgi:DNA-binding GntR family transcriptional regulator